MQQIRDALGLLVTGYPQQATATLDMLTHSDRHFFNNLAALITGNKTKQLEGKQLTAAIVTLKALALRYRNKGSAQDFLVLQDIYANIKVVIGSGRVELQNKRLLSGALSQLISGACSTHKQVLQLKEWATKSEDSQCSLVILDSIVSSSSMAKCIKIECVLQFMDLVMVQAKVLEAVLVGEYGGMGVGRMKGWLAAVGYLLDILVGIFCTLYQRVQHPYQYQSLVVLATNQQLCTFLLKLLHWQPPPTPNTRPYLLPCLHSFTLDNKQISQLYPINQLKQQTLQIISAILDKTAPDCRFEFVGSPLLREVPGLCRFALREFVGVSGSFEGLDQEYLLGSLYDSVVLFLAKCLRFQDLLLVFADNITQDQLVYCIGKFLKIRQADIGAMEGEYFGQFLQGFAGVTNLSQISRYSITQLINECCQKLDSFPSKMFQHCFHSILRSLHSRLASQQPSQDWYQHLYMGSNYGESSPDRQPLDIMSSLIGLIALGRQIEVRYDFRGMLGQFIAVMDWAHFDRQELSALLYLMGRHVRIFEAEDMLGVVGKLLGQVLRFAERDEDAAILCFQFVKQLYRFLVSQPMSSSSSSKYIQVCSQIVWPQLIGCFSLPAISHNEYLYETLRNLISISSLHPDPTSNAQTEKDIELNQFMKKQKTRSLIQIEKVGDYLLTEVSTVIGVVLRKGCHQLKKLLQVQAKNDLLILRVHQLILECVDSLHWINQIETTMEVKRIDFKQYASVVCGAIISIMQPDTPNQTQLSIEQSSNLIELLSSLISQQQQQSPPPKASQSCLSEQAFELLLPTLLANPFSQPWLKCICEFTHRIRGRYKLNQLESITRLIGDGLAKNFEDQRRVNEIALFAIVLLHYQQPENWSRLHQVVRVTLIKLVKVMAMEEKGLKGKKIRELGFESEAIFSITVIRVFHVYLFGFRMEPANQLLSQLLEHAQKLVQRYTLIEATYLIIGLKSSYKQMSMENIEKLVDLILLILHKLIANQNYYGNETYEEAKIRRLSGKIGCLVADPYQEFREFVGLMGQERIDFINHEKLGTRVRSLANISTCKGQPRKLYSILKPKLG